MNPMRQHMKIFISTNCLHFPKFQKSCPLIMFLAVLKKRCYSVFGGELGDIEYILIIRG